MSAGIALPCIVCGEPLSNVAGPNQPAGGIEFTTHGHYGTTLFDPMDGSSLAVNVCDPCLSLAAVSQRVLHYSAVNATEHWDGGVRCASDSWRDIPILNLTLTTRTWNMIGGMGVTTVGELTDSPASRYLRIPGFGQVSFADLCLGVSDVGGELPLEWRSWLKSHGAAARKFGRTL